jgi:uncharacterized protein (DUF1501 family)
MIMTNSRRDFLKLTTKAMGMLGATRLGMVNGLAQSASNYKALVCVFLFGGNDGFNTFVPMDTARYNAYKAIRGNVSLPSGNTQLLPVTALDGSPYGLNGGLAKVHPLWAQNKLAVIANVGMLMQPTSRAQYLAKSVALPSNLFSHSDQTTQMQAGSPTALGGTGWGGRVADGVVASNGAATFPASVSMAGPSLFCTGNMVQSASLLPGFDLTPAGMNFWPQSVADVKKAAFQEMLLFDSGMALVQQANKTMSDAMALNSMLKNLPGGALTTVFPGTSIGWQLNEVAKVLKLRTTTGMSRQVFFCSLGGFDTHGSQDWTHMDLLRQVGDAMKAFYDSTVELGVADSVTTFTTSEFGRTLQPSGAGTDHGWGSHHLIMGGAVKGGTVYGTMPTYALSGPEDSGNRGAMIPTTSIDQFGATLGKWFGIPQASLASAFPNIGNFGVTDLGFL